MNKKYQKNLKDIDDISSLLAQKQQEILDINQRISQAEGELPEIAKKLEKAIMSSNNKDIIEFEVQIETVKRLIGRNEILIDGIRQKIEQLEFELAVLEGAENKGFIDLAAKWLEDEIKLYDAAAIELKRRLGRLFACQELLRDKGRHEVYRTAVGSGFEFLPGIKIPILKNFDKSDFIDRRHINRASAMPDVFREITEGKSNAGK